MRYDFVAHMDDGEQIKSTSDGRDIRKWEATYLKTLVGETLSFTFLTQLAYIAARRCGTVGPSYPTYEIFEQHCVDLDLKRVGTEDEAGVLGNPTPPEATDDSSVS
jgi:hypothetical protein